MEMAKTVAANAVFRCHHGLIAVKTDDQPLLFAHGVQAALSEMYPHFRSSSALPAFLQLAGLMVQQLGGNELRDMRELVDVETVRCVSRASFAEDARRYLAVVRSSASEIPAERPVESALEHDGSSSKHWLFLTTVLASLTGDHSVRVSLNAHLEDSSIGGIVERHDNFIADLRASDGPTQQALWGEVLRNSHQASMLLLFGIREVDWVVPVFGTLPVSPAVHAQLRAAWIAMSALLHVESPDYQATLANIIKALEEELLQTYFEPFFSGGAVPDEPYNRERFGRLYDFGKRWPKQKPSLGEMTHFLKMAEQPEVSASSLTQFPSYVQSWIRFLWIERAATARPSLWQSLEEFSKLRNSNTHGGHSPTERDVALIGRARAWTIITHVARERTDDTLVRQRRSMRARELGL